MWGYWDNGPIKDEIGTLNMLTPMVVKQASAEIKTGEHVQLDWGLENVEFPSFGRRVFENRVLGKLETEEDGEDGKKKVVGGACVLDNELHFNTQSGSQWDGHKHVSSGMRQAPYTVELTRAMLVWPPSEWHVLQRPLLRRSPGNTSERHA